MCKYFEKFAKNNFTFISSWESKRLSNEKIRSINTSSFNSSPTFVYDNARIKVKFNGDFLKLDDLAAYNHGNVANIYIVYRLTPVLNDTSIVLKNCLFSAVEVRPNFYDVDKYLYNGYGIEFDSKGSFTHPSGGYSRTAIIFGADLSSSTHAKNKTKNILFFGEDFLQGLENTTIYAKKMYSANVIIDNKTFCLSLHYNGDSSYLFVNGKEIISFKAKGSKIVPYLGNISKYFSPEFTQTTI